MIESFRITTDGDQLILRPLVIFDDAHSLHPTQFKMLRRWLTRREMKVARWVLTRLDILNPSDVLLDSATTRRDRGAWGKAYARNYLHLDAEQER